MAETERLEDEGEFSAELRIKTKDVHDESDRLINLKLAAVLTDTKLWAKAVGEFYVVFQAIEDNLLRHRDHAHVGPLFAAVRDAFRTSAFERDLQFFLGDDWRDTVKPSTFSDEYCKRIARVATEDPTLLVAYVHSMYLAVLAGGQIIRRIVKKTLGLSGEKGLEIFEFGASDRTELRRQIKAAVDSLELTRSQKDAIIAEKIHIFHMNNAIANNLKTEWSSYKRLSMFVGLVLVIPVVVAMLARWNYRS